MHKIIEDQCLNKKIKKLTSMEHTSGNPSLVFSPVLLTPNIMYILTVVSPDASQVTGMLNKKKIMSLLSSAEPRLSPRHQSSRPKDCCVYPVRCFYHPPQPQHSY